MTTYAMQYVNENADIVIIEYERDKKTLSSYVSMGYAGSYEEPRFNEIFFCLKHNSEKDSFTGGTKHWFSTLGRFEIYDDDRTTKGDAYLAINEAIDNNELIDYFEQLIEEHNKVSSSTS